MTVALGRSTVGVAVAAFLLDANLAVGQYYQAVGYANGGFAQTYQDPYETAGARAGRPSAVDCGGHYASNCRDCPAGNGAVWCNGDCEWTAPVGALWQPTNDHEGVCRPKGMTFLGWLADLANVGRMRNMNPWWYYMSLGTSALILLVFSSVYYTQVVQQLPIVSTAFRSDRERGIFACFSSRSTCLYTTFCLPVVAGKNYHSTEVMGFWPGCIFTFIGTYTPSYLLVVCVRSILAMKVQERLGMKVGFMQTCCVNLFCMPCDIGRESIEVDSALGADITCCCNVAVKSRIIRAAEGAAGRNVDRMFVY